MEPTAVAIIDHDHLLRQLLCITLNQQDEFGVLWSTDCLQRARSRLLEAAPPDILLIEAELPSGSPFDLIHRVRRSAPGTRIAIFTNLLCDMWIDSAVKAGVAGYLLKREPIRIFHESLCRIRQGETVYSVAVRQRLRNREFGRPGSASPDVPLQRLTRRQLEVLRHLAMGASCKEVAKALHLSARSVKSHKYRIMQRLGIHDRVQLARYAIREGLAPL